MDSSSTNYNEMIILKLDRLEERTRDIATRADLEVLRKELVAQRELEPQLRFLSAQIERVDKDRKDDKEAAEKRMDKMEQEQLSKQDRLWMRISQAVGIIALVLTLLQLLTHLKLVP